MNALGLIVEYNPFHNGHTYHLDQAKRLTGADLTVCVMSGNFIQRGEPAIINKWARTKTALLSGIDLVIELPVVYSMASAEFFAFGAVKILDSLGIVNHICFGSENGNTEMLGLIADILVQEPDAYKKHLKASLAEGLSYPSSREYALKKYSGDIGLYKDSFDGILGFSNNILGIEYIKAIKKLKSNIKPIAIKRINNLYNSEVITGSISSATAVRKDIFKNTDGTLCGISDKTLPSYSLSVLKEEFINGRGPVSADMYENLILGLMRKMPAEKIAALPYVNEGLENRLKEASRNSGSIDELLQKVCTKRYTRTRLQRILFSILTGLTSDEFEEFNRHGGPQYIRVLGFNKNGRDMLSEIKKTAVMPIITKAANYKNSCSPLLKRMLEIEAAATDIYVLAYKSPEYRKAGQEYTQNIIRL